MSVNKTPRWVPSGRKPKAPHAPPPTPSRDELITQKVAIDVLGWAVKRAGEEVRAAKDKVGKRLVRAIANGDLLLSPEGLLKFGHVVAWGRPNWPTLLTAMPSASEEVVESAAISNDAVEALWIPSDLDACQAALTVAQERILELEQRIIVLEAELAAMRVKADKYDAIVATNRISGGKPKGS